MPDRDGGDVHGVLHTVSPAEMAAIDIFERAGLDFERRSVPLMGPNGAQLTAGAYCWIGATAGLERIEHGHFHRWLEETGRPAYREPAPE